MGDITYLDVGEAARQLGLSIRSLHYYESRGLLPGVRRSGGGRRRYSPANIQRLRQVAVLRSMGLGIEAIRACLEGRQLRPLDSLKSQLDELRLEIAAQTQRAAALEQLVARVEARGGGTEVAVQEESQLLALEASFLDEAERAQLLAYESGLGAQGLAERAREGRAIVEGVRAAMEAEHNPGAAEVVELGRRWRSYLDTLFDGDPDLRQRYTEMLGQAPELAQRRLGSFGIDRDLMIYLGRIYDHLDWT